MFTKYGSYSIFFAVLAGIYFLTALLYAIIILFNKWQPTCLYPPTEEDIPEEMESSLQKKNHQKQLSHLVMRIALLSHYNIRYLQSVCRLSMDRIAKPPIERKAQYN